MILITILIVSILGIVSEEIPCKKLYFFGNNLHNKAVLSPVIIVGKRGMKIPLEQESYKAAIDIKKIIKGSLGQWKKSLLIAGPFLLKNDSNDLCQFYSAEEDQIYFLQVLNSQNGEYDILFNFEIPSQENLDIINQTICKNCAGAPKMLIKDKSTTENDLILDCTTESKPPPIMKWTIQEGQGVNLTNLKKGVRLSIKSVTNIKNNMYTCTGANILGETTANIIIKNEVTRCAMNDKLLCNDNGKCYKDKIDGGKMFCRCNPDFFGTRCSNNPKKLSANYLIRVVEMDNMYCNKNGKGYTNLVTKKQYCICNDEFYGKTCSKINYIRSNTEAGKNLRNNKIEVTIQDKMELKRIIDEASTKAALKYIIIGGGMVLVGIVIVLFIILIIWKFTISKKTRQRESSNSKSFGRSSALHDFNSKPISHFDDGLILLPANTEMSKVPSNSKQKNSYIDLQKTDDIYNFTGNGIYEGIKPSHNQDPTSVTHIAL